MKITRRQLRQLIKEEFSILENQEGVDIEIPTEEELRAMLTDAGVAVKEQAVKIKDLLNKFATDPAEASQEIVDMYTDVGKEIIDAGESALSWLEQNIPKLDVHMNNPTPGVPSSNEGVSRTSHRSEKLNEGNMKITRRQLKTLIKEEVERAGDAEPDAELDIQEMKKLLGGLLDNIDTHVAWMLEEEFDVITDDNGRFYGELGDLRKKNSRNGQYTFQITYRLNMRNAIKVQNIWNKEIKGKAGNQSGDIDNSGNKVFKMSLVSIAKKKDVAIGEDVEVVLIVKIVLNDDWVQEKIEKYGPNSGRPPVVSQVNESSRAGESNDAGYEDGSSGREPRYLGNMDYMAGWETGNEDHEYDKERLSHDTDRDGVADFADTDQDNDGQVDILQGQRDIVHVRVGEIYEEDFLEADFAVWLGKNPEFTRVAGGAVHPLDPSHAVDNESWWVDGPEDGPSESSVWGSPTSRFAEIAQMPDSWARILGNCLGDKN